MSKHVSINCAALEVAVSQFNSNLTALREFVDAVEPVLVARTNEFVTKEVRNLAPMIASITAGKPDMLPTDAPTLDVLKSLFGAPFAVETIKMDGALTAKIGFDSLESSERFRLSYEAFERVTRHMALLYQSSLISLINMVEWFFARLMRFYYEALPDTLAGKDKVFSLDELRRFNSVSDARAYLIDKKVEDVLRGPFEDWITFFEGQPKLGLTYLDPWRDRLVETCLRRNILVHNGGEVNGIYLSKVPAQLAQGLTKNRPLEVTREYLDERIDLFERAAILIAAELWKKFAPKDEARSGLLIKVAYEHMKQGRWCISEALSRFTLDDRQLPESARLTATMNYWLCVKRLNRWAEVRSKVEEEDLGAKAVRFQLVRLALLDDADQFFKLLPVALKNNEIETANLAEFPVFEEMRIDPRCDPYLKPKPAVEVPPAKPKRQRRKKATPDSVTPL